MKNSIASTKEIKKLVSVYTNQFSYGESMNNTFKTSIGGQALIEGVMMKGPSKTAIAVRKPNGEIELKINKNFSIADKFPIFNLPILRGAVKLIEAMVIGLKAMTYSASFWDDDEGTSLSNKEIFLTLSLSVAMAIVFFILLPNLIASGLQKFTDSIFALNLLEGILRIVVFFIYLVYISKIDDIYRVFQYHGSEHKSIHCYEHGDELTVENVQKYPCEHPRCGTSFLFMVLAISIVVLSFFGWPNPILRVLIRILMFPVIAGIAYEINRWIGKSDSVLSKLLRRPGLYIQKIATVKEPDPDQIEVAIASLKAVLPREGENDRWM